MSEFSAVVLLFSWIAGVVLSHGFWWTLLAVSFPFYAWYLVIERALQLWGFIA